MCDTFLCMYLVRLIHTKDGCFYVNELFTGYIKTINTFQSERRLLTKLTVFNLIKAENFLIVFFLSNGH